MAEANFQRLFHVLGSPTNSTTQCTRKMLMAKASHMNLQSNKNVAKEGNNNCQSDVVPNVSVDLDFKHTSFSKLPSFENALEASQIYVDSMCSIQ